MSPLRVKGFKSKSEPEPLETELILSLDQEETIEEVGVITAKSYVTDREAKKNQPKKLHKPVRERAGVTWTIPPSRLAAECERASREPNFPNDAKGQKLKAKYGGIVPLGLTHFEKMLKEYWSDDPAIGWKGNQRMFRGCVWYFQHRLRNAGIKLVGYTSRPNLDAIEAVAPFCYVPLSELYEMADELTVTRNKYTEQATELNFAQFTNMSLNYFRLLLQDAVNTYGKSPQALAIHLSVGIYTDESIITEQVILELLEGRQPTFREVSELAKVIHHPITRKADPEWLYDTATRTNSTSMN